jgi:ABC-type branched-subunit amino acid transport system ATPase component
VLNGGAVMIRGTPGDVLGDPEIREVFLGD